MVKRLLVVALSLALAACGGTGIDIASAGSAAVEASAIAADAAGAKPPAPLAKTVIDEQGITATWIAYDTALDAINVLRRVNQIRDGSTFARGLAELIDKTTAALTAATAAQRAGNATSYTAALNEAKAALGAIRDLIKKEA